MPGLSAALLTEINPLARPERLRLLARRARELAGTPALDALLAELRTGDTFHRELRLFFATVAGHRDAVIATLADPDPELQSIALGGWLRSRPVTAGELWDLLADAPARLRRTAYRALRGGISAAATTSGLYPQRRSCGPATVIAPDGARPRCRPRRVTAHPWRE
ncbi:hypothetical protein GCM10009679_03020 [Saccharothrix algeriensis]